MNFEILYVAVFVALLPRCGCVHMPSTAPDQERLAATQACAQAVVDYVCGSEKKSVQDVDVASRLMVSPASVREFFTQIGMHNELQPDDNLMAYGKHKYQANCAKLCSATLASLSQDIRPTYSDQGCYWKTGHSKMVCDIDLRPKALAAMRRLNNSVIDTSLALGEFGGGSEDVKVAGSTIKAAQRGPEYYYPRVTADEVKVGVAEMFRIYPPTRIELKTQDNTGAGTPWHTRVIQSGVKAKALLNVALCAASDGKLTPAVGKSIQAAFGEMSDSGASFRKKELRRSFSNMRYFLSDIEYRYLKSNQCSEKQFAYVNPKDRDSARNHRGENIMYLCDAFVAAPQADQIYALLHLGSRLQASPATDSVDNVANASSMVENGDNMYNVLMGLVQDYKNVPSQATEGPRVSAFDA
eukprot:TRINITY_DN14263_c0_g1_i1.p1 TRINITY_DN14263_c0_g1~~TRINITY_DN14263_c0_g1_i1.p1  ORF type:complete len:412 (-),score=71.49 TRINITY_DN14263_c0_g1_i1:194-1429(-)